MSVEKQLVERWWPTTGGELEFHEATGGVTLALYDAWRTNDWEEARLIFRTIDSARKRWPQEPQASILDHAYALAAACLASWCVSEHEFDASLAYVQIGWDALDDKQERRTSLGLPAAPSTEARLRLLSAVAAAKWRSANDEFAGHFLTIEQMHEAFLKSSAQLRDYLTASTLPVSEQLHYIEPMLWSGSALAIALRRDLSDKAEALVKLINEWHTFYLGSAILSSETGASTSAQNLPDLPLRWHYEIGKLWVTGLVANRNPSPDEGPGLEQELAELFGRLNASLDRDKSEAGNLTFQSGLQRDWAWMMTTLRKRRLQIL